MRRRALVLAVIVSTGACSFDHGSLATSDGAAADGDAPVMIDAPLGPWGTAADIGLSSGTGDDDPSLTGDMLEIYWGSHRGSGPDEDIYVSRRATINDAWSQPASVNELDTSAGETTTKVTSDGLAILFASDRINTGNYDIYIATRATRADPWGTPARITEISTGGGDYAAYANKGLKHLVLCAGLSLAEEALYTSDRPVANEPWGAPQKIAELDEPDNSECDPMEPRTGVLYFSSQHGNLDGTYDIYRVERPSVGPWGTPVKVDGINMNTFHDRDPWVSADERTMFFSSNRDGVDRIYMSAR